MSACGLCQKAGHSSRGCPDLREPTKDGFHSGGGGGGGHSHDEENAILPISKPHVASSYASSDPHGNELYIVCLFGAAYGI